MGSLPRAKAGVGSAMNDTTRQVGGALGVAVVGSVMTSVYGPRVASAFTSAGLPVGEARHSLFQALQTATNPRVAPALQGRLVTEINDAFVAGLHRGVLFAAAATFIGVLLVVRWLPARGNADSVSNPVPTPDPTEEDLVVEPA